MRTFIDIGGWNGCSTEFFLKYHPNGRDFKHFIFEPDKRHIETLKRKKLNVIPKAAWFYNGEVKFYYATSSTKAGGTMFAEKKTGGIDKSRFYTVPCIDIREFIENLEADYIVIKLNCEGGEYTIIPRLEGIKIDKWYVQWHYDKIGLKKEGHDEIASMIDWHPWKAQFNQQKFIKEFISTCDTW